MTNEEFDSKLLPFKMPFRVSEAARQILVNGYDWKDVITGCGIKKEEDFKMLEAALIELRK